MGSSDCSDRELVGRVLAGDLQAFEDIVRRYRSMVLATARRYAGNSLDSEDVVQQAFLTAFVGMHGLRDPSRLPAWLCSIARFTCSNWRRGPYTEAAPENTEHLAEILQGREPERPDELLEQGELRERIQRALAALPPGTGEVVTLYYMDGLSYEDIAASLSVPTTTVKGRLQMGRERLRKELGDMIEDTTIRELLEQATTAARQAGLGKLWEPRLDEALALVEQALAHAATLATAHERDTARLHALVAKAGYLFRSEAAVRQRNNEEALELARRLKDHEAIGGLLAERVDWSGGEERVRLLGEAAREFHRAGQPARESEALLFQASWMIGGRRSEAESLFRRARELVADGGEQGPAWAAVCDAALEFIASIDPNRGLGTLHEYGWAAEVLRREPDGSVTYQSQPGFSSGRLRGSPIHDAATMRVLVDGRRRAGERWSAETFSYGSRPLQTTATVVGDEEEVQVPAGTFRGCRLIRLETVDPHPEGTDDARLRHLNRILVGTREIWYARGVGLVRVRVHTEWTQEEPVGFVLREVEIKEARDEWFPLALGNRWTYAREGKTEEEYRGAHLLQVRAVVGETYHLSHSCYGYAVGAAAEREAHLDNLTEAGLCAASEHRWEEAVAAYEQALAEGPNRWAATMLGRVLWRTGQYERAVAVLEPETSLPHAQLCLAWCYDLLGRREEALRAYRHLLTLSPQSSLEIAAQAGIEEPHQARKRPGVAPGKDEQELDPQGWSATAHPHGEIAHLAIDRDPETRWSTRVEGQYPGMYFQLDLGTVQPVSRVVLDDDASGNTIHVSDYPRQYEVKVSVDGETWALVAAAAGDPRCYAEARFAAQDVRFIRIEQTGSGQPESWSIYEIHVFGPKRG